MIEVNTENCSWLQRFGIQLPTGQRQYYSVIQRDVPPLYSAAEKMNIWFDRVRLNRYTRVPSEVHEVHRVPV